MLRKLCIILFFWLNVGVVLKVYCKISLLLTLRKYPAWKSLQYFSYTILILDVTLSIRLSASPQKLMSLENRRVKPRPHHIKNEKKILVNMLTCSVTFLIFVHAIQRRVFDCVRLCAFYQIVSNDYLLPLFYQTQST